MTNEAFVAPDERDRNLLRAAIADFTLHLAPYDSVELASSWQRLVSLIQPEPEPLRRPCPHCQGRIMQQATRCLYCLQKSAPPSNEQAH